MFVCPILIAYPLRSISASCLLSLGESSQAKDTVGTSYTLAYSSTRVGGLGSPERRATAVEHGRSGSLRNCNNFEGRVRGTYCSVRANKAPLRLHRPQRSIFFLYRFITPSSLCPRRTAIPVATANICQASSSIRPTAWLEKPLWLLRPCRMVLHCKTMRPPQPPPPF